MSPFTRTNSRNEGPQRPSLWARFVAWVRNLFH